MAMTHSQLVERAAKWLRNSVVIPSSHTERYAIRCPVVVTGLAIVPEIPDAIGWAYGGRVSVLIECKASRSDFCADKEKHFRKHPEKGMGQYRYMMAPAGLLRDIEMPDGWGLAEVQNRSVIVRRLPTLFETYSWRHEMQLLWSAARRMDIQSVVIDSGYRRDSIKGNDSPDSLFSEKFWNFRLGG